MGVCNNMSCDGFRGVVGFENLLCSSYNGGDADVIRQRLCGSGFPKQESRVDGDELRAFKLPKTASQGCNNGNNPSQQMLCFSSPNSQMLSFSSENSHSQPLPFYHRASAAVARTPGFGMHGVRYLFTPSQWMELEHQALIYKYITANVPIPSYLLNPIRKALESYGCFSILRSNALGWGGFHLGFSNSDPEPGRCRRTDGKKWRCSRDAVPDQKYCERHINRGRHRSRKPVEASVSGTPNAVVSEGGASKSLSLLPLSNGKNTATDSVVDKESSTGAFQQTTPLVSMAPVKSSEQQSAYMESEFGLVCSDSLLNPLNKISSFVNDGVSKSQHVVLQFMDAYPKSHSPRLPVPWSNIDLQSDRTQLSISIPCASPTNDKLKKAPFRLCEEGEAMQMGLGVGWEPSVGGPLGEALHSTSESKALNLIQNWDHTPRLGSSYRSSLSNNSPRAESSSTLDAAGFCIAQGLMLPSLPAL